MKTFLSLLLCMSLSAQAEIIDFTRIRQKKVRKLMAENALVLKEDFKRLETTCFQDDGSYSKNTKSFLIKASPDAVWAAYKGSKPRQCWIGKLVSFGCLYDSPNTPMVYDDNEYSGMKVGQILFIQLRLFGGIYKLAVAHKVVAVNEESRSLQICYLKRGASEGSQFIRLIPTPEGYTEVLHETYYKSSSAFRDKRIYPGIHEKVISAYHENVASTLRTDFLVSR
ncbi:hypothetical protein [Leadbetterella byssophila]|uniref:hypothetical protein n=1 Tax=Leadbetterella byssophila TaxID=316068 RepID=UPI0039A268A2